jgi:hypothetical protein
MVAAVDQRGGLRTDDGIAVSISVR